MARKNVLLIISGSIAAYKSLELIRRLREHEFDVRCILTKGGAEFITPLSVASLSGNPCYSDLFSLKDEAEMGHIRLTREADIIVVAPASADLIAKMAGGQADDLASACLLANNKKRLLVAPAMNTQMWDHPATQRNLKQIAKDGALLLSPGEGMLACGEKGAGRMAEPETILLAVRKQLDNAMPLRGVRALVTSGPTQEAIDPVRYIGNRSSGKQGHAIAKALAAQGAQVTLITGPTALPDPYGVSVKRVTTAAEMLTACERALPADVAVLAAAVSDWRAAKALASKMKKKAGKKPPSLTLIENPDILHYIATHKTKRPDLVIGFAAETEDLLKNASSKRGRKGCDWIVANDVSGGKVFGADDNQVTLVTSRTKEPWPAMTKDAVAEKLADKIINHFRKEKS
jgi:phosphopantothenoylcysteine decarboxylase / phosphopantothenate---cysteine ligase